MGMPSALFLLPFRMYSCKNEDRALHQNSYSSIGIGKERKVVAPTNSRFFAREG
jgi:hypothetical protein